MNNKILLLALLCTNLLLGQQTQQAVIFDNTGVIFRLNTIKAALNMGPKTILGSIVVDMWNLRYPTVLKTRELFLSSLEELEATPWAKEWQAGTMPCKDERQRILPPIMVDILKGNITPQEVYKKLQTKPYKTETERRLVLCAAQNILPENLIEIMCLNEDVLEVIKEIKNSGHKIAVLTNYGLGYNLLLEKYPIIKELFKENIFVSSETKEVKPCSQAYELVANGIKIPLCNCIMIDDQEENLPTESMKTILYKDAGSLRKSLIAMGILKD